MYKSSDLSEIIAAIKRDDFIFTEIHGTQFRVMAAIKNPNDRAIIWLARPEKEDILVDISLDHEYLIFERDEYTSSLSDKINHLIKMTRKENFHG